MSKYAVLVFLVLFWGEAIACSIPAQGTYWTHDELIDRTETILLVTPVAGSHGANFKILETLKGSESTVFQWRRFRPKDPHRSEDFDGHENPGFWQEGDELVIRATYYPGACTLQFTFVDGEKYLIFKESAGHPHSAEIIKSLSDKWYEYVRARVTHNK